MVVFKKASTATKSRATPGANQQPANEASNGIPPGPKRWSDITASRQSTHPSLSASNRLFGTYELCEQILNCLPMKEVVRATRVCRSIKEVVGNSTRLQTKLFILPDSKAKTFAVSDSRTLLSGLRAEQHIAATEAGGKGKTGEVALFVFHPLLSVSYTARRFKQAGMVQFAINHVEANHSRRGEQRQVTISNPRIVKQRLNISTISDMLLSQPPVKTVILDITAPKRTPQVPIHSETGVTFGQVLRAVFMMKADPPYADGPPNVYLRFEGGFIVEPGARKLAEEAGELSVDDDPTRWVKTGSGTDDYALKDGGIPF